MGGLMNNRFYGYDRGDIVFIEGQKYFFEICDIINENRFTAYVLIGTNIRLENFEEAQLMDFHFERNGVIRLFCFCKYEIIGQMIDGVPIFYNEFQYIPKSFFSS